MEVPIDPAGRRDQAGGVDDVRTGRRKIRSDSGDRRVLDQEVSALAWSLYAACSVRTRALRIRVVIQTEDR